MIDWTAASSVWVRNWTLYRRTGWMNVIPNFFEPFFYLVSIGVGLGAYVGGFESTGGYLAFIAPGLLASQAMMGASFEVTYNCFVKMRFHGVYDAILTTPAEVEDIVAGEILWAITRALVYGSAFFVIATLFGLVTTPMALLCFPALALVGAMFASIGLAFTSRIPVIDLYSYYFTLFLTPMFLFSAVFYPLDRFPSWLQPVAALDPLYHAVAVTRSLFSGRVTADLLVHALWMICVTAIAHRLAVAGMRRRLIS